MIQVFKIFPGLYPFLNIKIQGINANKRYVPFSIFISSSLTMIFCMVIIMLHLRPNLMGAYNKFSLYFTIGLTIFFFFCWLKVSFSQEKLRISNKRKKFVISDIIKNWFGELIKTILTQKYTIIFTGCSLLMGLKFLIVINSISQYIGLGLYIVIKYTLLVFLINSFTFSIICISYFIISNKYVVINKDKNGYKIKLFRIREDWQNFILNLESYFLSKNKHRNVCYAMLPMAQVDPIVLTQNVYIFNDAILAAVYQPFEVMFRKADNHFFKVIDKLIKLVQQKTIISEIAGLFYMNYRHYLCNLFSYNLYALPALSTITAISSNFKDLSSLLKTFARKGAFILHGDYMVGVLKESLNIKKLGIFKTFDVVKIPLTNKTIEDMPNFLSREQAEVLKTNPSHSKQVKEILDVKLVELIGAEEALRKLTESGGSNKWRLALFTVASSFIAGAGYLAIHSSTAVAQISTGAVLA